MNKEEAIEALRQVEQKRAENLPKQRKIKQLQRQINKLQTSVNWSSYYRVTSLTLLKSAIQNDKSEDLIYMFATKYITAVNDNARYSTKLAVLIAEKLEAEQEVIENIPE